jgi:hypothetical protein
VLIPPLFQLVSLSEFEKHAGSVARHPSDYIFLDDGRNLRQLVEEAQAVAAGKTLPAQEMVLWAPLEPASGGALGLEPAVEGACSACGEEGNVLKCSSCSREYHAGGFQGFGPSFWCRFESGLSFSFSERTLLGCKVSSRVNWE